MFYFFADSSTLPGVDEMNPPASGTRHRLVGLAIC